MMLMDMHTIRLVTSLAFGKYLHLEVQIECLKSIESRVKRRLIICFLNCWEWSLVVLFNYAYFEKVLVWISGVITGCYESHWSLFLETTRGYIKTQGSAAEEVRLYDVFVKPLIKICKTFLTRIPGQLYSSSLSGSLSFTGPFVRCEEKKSDFGAVSRSPVTSCLV